jgi:hypothetical protein
MIELNPMTKIGFLKELTGEVTVLQTDVSKVSVLRQKLVEIARNMEGLVRAEVEEHATEKSETTNFWQL